MSAIPTNIARYAHTIPEHGRQAWEPIEQHLVSVEERAREFAAELGRDSGAAADWGCTVGRWHDLGKYSDAFQAILYDANGEDAHLENTPGRVDHSTAGAQYAREVFPKFGNLLAYVIAGHHSGLADAEKLGQRLTKTVHPWKNFAKPDLLIATNLQLPPLTLEHRDLKRFAFQCSFFTRMLFSCLLDADRLETEAFCNPAQAALRLPPLSIAKLADTLDEHLDHLARPIPSAHVNRCRREVLLACRNAASLCPGLFSLTVPTGGGKTLASLDFALKHAVCHGQRRVVVAMPFTSIIEQTADIYRGVFSKFGDAVVVEHHSNVDPAQETRRNRLAAENWDAPLIVTTNVQLFESLFACRTASCRKLHRLAASVIILDEAQALPVGLLQPCLAALRELVTDYRCTIVLCTATQPALAHREEFPIGLEAVREIVPEPEKLYVAMRRVEVNDLGRLDDDGLVQRLANEPTWLTIVNTRAHAAHLYQRLQARADGMSEGLYHLSTLMCGQHRSEKLAQIRNRLDENQPCRVVSTQLIEAGVDIDFPVVCRAMAGVDSVAQAAGRCNREGRLPELGKVWLFDPLEVQPKGYLGATAATTRELLPDQTDVLDPAAVRRYFELHYWKQEGDHRWDEERVMECFPEERGRFAYNFRTAAERFRFIKDLSQTVFVPYANGGQLIERLRDEGPDRMLLRQLQRFAVGIFAPAYEAMLAAGDLEILASGYSVLVNTDQYDDNLGLLLDTPGQHQPESLVL